MARRAQHLDGYGGLWLDTARDARPPEQVDQDAAAGRDDVSRWIVNVRVTGDVAEARQFLRQVWSGGLCVVPGERTEADLRAVQRELTDQPGMLSAGVDDQHVALEVVHDDGTLQRRLDERYGRGVVVVTSALQPVR